MGVPHIVCDCDSLSRSIIFNNLPQENFPLYRQNKDHFEDGMFAVAHLEKCECHFGICS